MDLNRTDIDYEKKIIIYAIIFVVILILTNIFQQELIHFLKTTQNIKSKPNIFQPSWLDLSEKEQELLYPLKKDWTDIMPNNRIVLVLQTKRILKLDQRNIMIFKRRIQYFSKLQPQEKTVAIENYLKDFEISQNIKIKTWEWYLQLSPEEKAILEKQAFKKKSILGAPSLSSKLLS